MSNIFEESCFFTGHRFIQHNEKNMVKEKLTRACIALIEKYNVSHFICGGAIGFDTMAALTIIRLKKIYPNIRLHLYLPCTNQSSKWNDFDKKMLEYIKVSADDFKYITNAPYATGCMQLRNNAMANDALFCIAYCKNKSSGTYSTIRTAQKLNRKILCIT